MRSGFLCLNVGVRSAVATGFVRHFDFLDDDTSVSRVIELVQNVSQGVPKQILS